MTKGPKEKAYDEHMEPLVKQIIALAKQHKINILFYTDLDGDMFSRTIIPADDKEDFRWKSTEFRLVTGQP